jgi:hypothetical protein
MSLVSCDSVRQVNISFCPAGHSQHLVWRQRPQKCDRGIGGSSQDELSQEVRKILD